MTRTRGAMTKARKIANLVIFVPLGILLIVLCVANRESVTLALNPFQPQDSVLSVSAPLFVLLFVSVIFGMAVGSAVTWLSQGRYRKQARIEAREAIKWQQNSKPGVSPVEAKQLRIK